MLAQMEALRAERDAAMRDIEQRERYAEEQMRLLVEEQDRFVSRMIEAHERDIGRLRLELEEARTSASRYEQKLERDRAASARLEEDLAEARSDVQRLRDQRDGARMEMRRLQQAYVTAQSLSEQLRRELDLARSMLGDAMASGGNAPSGIVDRAQRRAPPLPPRRSASSAARESVPPRRAAGSAANESVPPSR